MLQRHLHRIVGLSAALAAVVLFQICAWRVLWPELWPAAPGGSSWREWLGAYVSWADPPHMLPLMGLLCLLAAALLSGRLGQRARWSKLPAHPQPET